ncbi:hypothetical protein DYD21_06660 [Rhodohalobacter sp. SW132]|uniref:serine hydrolase n=1 Tax=Rhodohalobacter sp. SW132 TaxID=2293433 RepID=UPI000E21DF37|nr:serine hydrolase [Rhodohalobacter sp. SW132]REL38283.1 hypothetical protein DYD21_06660 [Rhodohalobacter sp. SW132]
MGRALKFFAAFFFTAVIIFGSILFLNWQPFTVFFENRDAMVEGSEWVEETYSLQGLSRYIEQNPEHVSFVSKVMVPADSTIRYGEDIRRPMGTTSNLFILIAGAAGIENGDFNPDTRIQWSSISSHQLPDVNQSEHEQSFRAADRRGWIQDGEITLDHAMKLLAEYNDLALSDYLWWNIGPERWDALSQTLQLEQTDLPLPFSGLYMTLSPGLRQMEADEIYRIESEKETADFRSLVIDFSERFLHEDDFRDSVRTYTREKRLGNTFMEERDGLGLFPKTTAREMTDILEQIASENLISPGVSNQVMEWLRWPMEQQSGITRDFSDYGAIYDHRMGLLTGIDIGTSAYTGDTTVQAVFFDRIQIAFWFHMSSNHMHQDFQQRMIFDPAMIIQMQQVADRAGNGSATVLSDE